MPRVPTYDNLQTNVSGGFDAQFRAPSGTSPGEISANQMQGLGVAITNVGMAREKIALEEKSLADQVRLNDASNQLSIATQNLTFDVGSGFLSRKGANAFLDKEGKPLAAPLDQEYGEKLKNRVDEIRASLGNDQQRLAFDAHAGKVAAQFHGSVSAHMGQQFGHYQDAVDDSKVKLAAQSAELNWNNPNVVGEHVKEAEAAIRRKAERLGLVGAPYEEAVLAGKSAIHENVLLSALQAGNNKYAADYLAANKNSMTAKDILRVNGHITEAQAVGQAQAAVREQSAAAQQTIAPTHLDVLHNVNRLLESNNQHTYADGTTKIGWITKTDPVTGAVVKKEGGIGVRQVTAKTGPEAAKMAGLPWDESKLRNNQAYNEALGRAYLDSMVREFNGDPLKALAAYNAGPGGVRRAMAAAEKDAQNYQGSMQGALPENAWRKKLPRETQDYLLKAEALFAKGGQNLRPAKPTEQDFIQGALARVGQNASSLVIKHTTDLAKQQFSSMERSFKDAGDNALADAQRWAIETGATSLNGLPTRTKDALMQYAPGRLDDLDRFVKERGKVETNTSLYLTFVTHPEVMAKMSDAEFASQRLNLEKSDFDKLAAQRATLLKGGSANGVGDLNHTAINQTLSDRLRSLRLDPSPKDGSVESAQIGAVHKFVRDSVAQAQLQAGKKFSDAETAQHIDGLFAKNVQFKGLFGFGSEKSRALLSTKASDIPSDVANDLRKNFAKVGNLNPSDGDLLGAYFRYQSSLGKTKNHGATGQFR